MKRMGWDDQMGGLQTIDQVHIQSAMGSQGINTVARLETGEEDGME